MNWDKILGHAGGLLMLVVMVGVPILVLMGIAALGHYLGLW